MKRPLLLILIVLLCSFNDDENTTLHDNGLKGRVKRLTEYAYSKNKGVELLTGKKEWAYDLVGNEVYRKYISMADSTHPQEMTRQYKYNGDGNKVEEKVYHADGSPAYKTIFIYDPDKHIAQTTRYRPDNGLMMTCLYEMSPRGNKLACACTGYGPDDSINTRYTYGYDEQSHMVEEHGANGGATLTMKYEHDNLVEYRSYKPTVVGGDLHVTRYTDIKKDKQDNWIKRTEITEHKGVMDTVISRREISYY